MRLNNETNPKHIYISTRVGAMCKIGLYINNEWMSFQLSVSFVNFDKSKLCSVNDFTCVYVSRLENCVI